MQRFPCLDAYRAIGMTMVIIFHADFASIAHSKGFLDPLMNRFDLSLGFFFVLSAFLLYRPYAVAQFEGRPGLPIRRFYRHRVLRIFPAYWFALLVMVVLFGLRFQSFGDFVSFALIIQTYTGQAFKQDYQQIYQAWSLATELAFYALLPLFAVWVRRRTSSRTAGEQLRFILLASAAAYVFGVGSRVYVAFVQPSWQEVGILALPSWLDLFAIGVALAAISAWSASTGHKFAPLEWLGRHPAWSWTGAAAVFFLTTRFQPDTRPLVLNGTEYVTRYFLYGIVSVLFLAPGMFGDQQAGRLRAVLRSRVLVFMGTVSLGFYLFHVAFLDQAEDWLGSEPFQASFWRILLIAYPLTLLTAMFSYYVVERPFLRAKRQRFRAVFGRLANSPAP